MTRAHVALSDCEEIHDGFLAQPANAVSSLGFVVVAVPVAVRALRARRWAWVGVAAATALAGIGSVAYHGPGGRGSKLVHDVGVDALAATMVLALSFDGSFRRVSPRTAALTGAAITLHRLSRTGGPLCSCHSPLQGHAIFHLLAAAAVTSAAADQRR